MREAIVRYGDFVSGGDGEVGQFGFGNVLDEKAFGAV